MTEQPPPNANQSLMMIRLNGEDRPVPRELTLARLLEWLELPADSVAVERNLEIVPRIEWPQTTILPGDRLEVVHFVGGGAGDRVIGLSSQGSMTP